MTGPIGILGAGIAGVSLALQLQARGVPVILLDRSKPGGGTSYGNAGLIEMSALLPHPCPQDIGTLARYALNLSPDLRWTWAGLGAGIYQYWRNSRADRIDTIGASFRTLMRVALAEHRALAHKAGALDLLRACGWLELIRDPRALEIDRAADMAQHGIAVARLDSAALRAAEPDLRQPFAGAFHWQGTVSITDPGAYVARMAEAFRTAGGEVVSANVTDLVRRGAGWRIASSKGAMDVAQVVVALGPWSPDLLQPLGLSVPMLFKRGYHQHFAAAPGCRLRHPVHLPGSGHLVVPMTMGLRVLTGVELARRDAPSDLRQIQAAARAAHAYLPLGAPVDPPWLGNRPCLPDMLPLIGETTAQPGLWCLFGHGHHGLTQGPASARLLAEMMTGEAPFIDPTPFAPSRMGL